MLPCTSKDEEKRIKLLNSLANVQSCPYDMEFKPLCEALLLFIQTYNRIPFHSKLPDMVSDTQRYLELQKIFEKKAQLDQRLLGELLTSSVPSDVFTRFCQSLNQLQFLNTPPLNASSTFQCISSENLEFVWIEWMLIAQNQFLFHHEQFTDFENDIIVFQKYMDVRKKWLLQNQKLQEWSKWDDWVNELYSFIFIFHYLHDVSYI
ncbi:hypothetical protein HMI55_004998 [Coelomomyces lativittatus]|nr:hypothetical protein HMI55_004998 [Coelomomyces lativittatus]